MKKTQEVSLSISQKRQIDLLLKKLIELLSLDTLQDYGKHSLRNMLWREIFFEQGLGSENEELTGELLWEYIDIVKEAIGESEINLDESFSNMEDQLMELEELWREEDLKRRKQGEIGLKIEQLWKQKEFNNREIHKYYKLRDSLELEEEEKLEKEWDNKSITELNKKVEENLEKRRKLEEEKEKVYLELKKLKQAQQLLWDKKEEYCSRYEEYSYELSRLHSKLDRLCIRLQRDCEENERRINLALLEFSKKITGVESLYLGAPKKS
ncbi:hypothetical protein [Candidatus Mycoplasma haematominutum]|uniref:hypothetical protein n=1 Tax=Candidatus Mycoplasma haematominutum TaxID=209446 RepID=UPI00031EC60D|nr:hypothetical protein [Candidatus Mycoplasma haematominutum]